MQKSEFPKMHHYVGFSQIGSQLICSYRKLMQNRDVVKNRDAE